MAKRSSDHNHPPHDREVMKSAAMSKAKYDTSTTTSNVARAALDSNPAGVKAILPPCRLIAEQNRNYREKVNSHLISPALAADLEFPEAFMSTLAGLRLLQADMNSPMGKRILIFATDLILEGINVAAINIILMDGTFKVAPPQFMQLWIIRVQFERSHIPVLLPDRAAVAQHQMPPAPSISSPLRLRESITMGLQDGLPLCANSELQLPLQSASAEAV